MNKIHLITAMFEIHQMVLKDKDLLDKNGRPIKDKHMSAINIDAIELYKHLGLKTIENIQAIFDASKEEFNKYAKSLHDEVYLNMYLMSLFILEKFFDEYGTKAEQIVIGGKISRLIPFMKSAIREHDKDYETVIYDSAMAADNIYRNYNGQPELTREMREKRKSLWQEAFRKSKK